MGTVLVLLFLWISTTTAWSQSCTITSPTAAQSVTGYKFPLTISTSSLPSIARVVYTVDTILAGQSLSAPWSVVWDPYNQLNGPHAITATAYNSLGAVLANCPEIDFVSANTGGPFGASTPAFTVTPSTAFTSPWANTVTLTFAPLSGQRASVFVDGILVPQDGAASTVLSIDTRAFDNGPHSVGWRLTSTTALYDGGVLCGNTANQNRVLSDYGEGARKVTFSNGAAPMEVRVNAAEIWLSPTQTFTLTGQLCNTDETCSAATMQYFSQYAPIATVNQSTGVVTAVAAVGAVNINTSTNPDGAFPGGSGQILATAVQYSFSDLVQHGTGTAGSVSSVSHQFTGRDINTVLYITGGAGWTTGTYIIDSVSSGNATLLQNGVHVSPAPAATTGGVWKSGPTETVWVYVRSNPNQKIPHFSKTGTILTSGYVAGSSFVLGSSFGGQNDTYQGFSNYAWPTFGADYAASGLNGYEVNCVSSTIFNLQASWSTNQTTMNNAITSWVSSHVAQIAPYPSLRMHLHCETETRNLVTNAYPTMNSPSSVSFSPTAITNIRQQFAATGLVVANTEADESSSTFGSSPAQFPMKIGNFGLTGISSNGTTCTFLGRAPSFGQNIGFKITGSAPNNGFVSLNSASPSGSYTSGQSFSCPGSSVGTYTASNDAGLTIEKYAQCWFSATTGGSSQCAVAGAGPYTDLLKSSFLADYATQVRAASPTVAMAWPPLGSLGAYFTAQYSHPTIADYAEFYFQPGGYNYFTVKNSINNQISIIGTGFRQEWSGVGDTQPWLAEVSGQPSNYGLEGYTSPAITSCSGNTFTFASDHGVRNLIPRGARMTVASGTCAGQYFILSAPTSTTLTVALAAPNFTSTLTAPFTGTLTTQDGTTFTTTQMGGVSGRISQDPVQISNACSPNNIGRVKGQTFKISGATPAGSPFNFATSGNQFVIDAASYQICTSPSTFTGTSYWHQIPQLSGSGGTASILPDMDNIRGRNLSFPTDVDNDSIFVNAIFAFGLGAAGFRQYQSDADPNTVSATQGWVGNVNGIYGVFGDTCTGTKQLGTIGNAEVNPLNPNASTRASMYAAGNANRIATRIAPYLFQQRLPSPDYGQAFECFARSGGPGQMLMCINMTNSPQTRTFAIAAYETGGQKVVRFLVNAQGIALGTITAGTSTDNLTVPAATAAIYLFPTNFAIELQQPTIAVRMADVPNATKVVVRYSYDPYNLEIADITNRSQDCGTGTCLLNADRNIGAITAHVMYLNASGVLLQNTDVLTF